MKEEIKQEIQEPPEEAKPLVRQRAVREEPIINPRDNIVQNHYYYYGVPPPASHPDFGTGQPEPKKKKKGRKSKRPPTPSSSSEEEFSDIDEPETYQDQYQTQPQENYDIVPETKIPKLKFNFA